MAAASKAVVTYPPDVASDLDIPPQYKLVSKPFEQKLWNIFFVKFYPFMMPYCCYIYHLETRHFNGGKAKMAFLTSIIFSKTSHRCDVFEKMIDVSRGYYVIRPLKRAVSR